MDVVLQDRIAYITFPYPPPAEKDEVKRLGARWNPADKRWVLDLSINSIQWLLNHGIDVPETIQQTYTEALSSSRSAELLDTDAASVSIVAPEGLSYRPFQEAGIAWAVKRPSVLIGDDMGLGKTIQALGVINSDETVKSALIVCPLSVALNWQKESSKWLVRPLSVEVADTSHLPDSDLVIVHWGIIAKHKEAIRQRDWDLVVLDEAHYAKNIKAVRTRAILGSRQDNLTPLSARRKIALTGTPIPNRPIEMYPILKWLDPSEFGNWLKYVTRYCAGTQTPWGWDVSGASNLDELQTRLRTTVMIRRMKTAVLDDLPPKTRQIIELEASNPQVRKALAIEMETTNATADAIATAACEMEIAKASDDEEEYLAAVKRFHDVQQLAFTQMSEARHTTAMAKVPFVLSHLQDMLMGNASKVVVFCHHRDVLESLRQGLSTTTSDWLGVDTVSIMGGDSPESRQEAVDSFQKTPGTRVFLGTIGAAREGITLTASSTAVFAEIDWVPGNMSQAEDRIYRIGQNDAVTIQHILIEGSIDAKMIKTIVSKQEVIDSALDNISGDVLFTKPDPDQIIAPTEALAENQASTASVSRTDISVYATIITDEEITRVHGGLQALAAMDPDHAQSINNWGFNKIDAYIGHELAARNSLTPKQAVLGAKILVKYHRQVGQEVSQIWKVIKAREVEPQQDLVGISVG